VVLLWYYVELPVSPPLKAVLSIESLDELRTVIFINQKCSAPVALFLQHLLYGSKSLVEIIGWSRKSLKPLVFQEIEGCLLKMVRTGTTSRITH
jgi:hypothetical protein